MWLSIYCGAGNRTRGLVYARQASYWVSSPSSWFYMKWLFAQQQILANYLFCNESLEGEGFLSPVTIFPSLLGIFEIRRKQHLQWVSDLRWKQCQYISSQMEPFSLLCKSLLSNQWQWNAFRDAKAVYYLMGTPFSTEGLSPQESQRSPQEGRGLSVLT